MVIFGDFEESNSNEHDRQISPRPVRPMTNLKMDGEPDVSDYVVVTNAYDEWKATSARAVVRFDPPTHIHGNIWIAQLGLLH